MTCLNGSLEVGSTPGVRTEAKVNFEAQIIEVDPNVSFFSFDKAWQ